MSKRKMLMAVLAVFGFFTMLGGTASAQNSNSSTTMTGGQTSQTMAVSSTDRKFMMQAAAGGIAEVEMARLALEKAASEDVKKYAQQMIDDHTKANEELMQIASQKGVNLPTTPDAKHMALMQRMRNLSGAAFDRMYIREAGIKDHATMEKLFMKESGNGKDQDVRGFATRTLPAVQMHLRMAREISGGMTTGAMKSKM